MYSEENLFTYRRYVRVPILSINLMLPKNPKKMMMFDDTLSASANAKALKICI